MASTTSGDVLPTGFKIFSSVPDIFFIPEFVFGGLVWILVASTRIYPLSNPLGWVMFVSVFCFVGTSLWIFLFLCGGNQASIWPAVDVCFHFVAVVFYLSASVILAYVTLGMSWVNSVGGSLSGGSFDLVSLGIVPDDPLKIYRLDIAAVVMSYVATLLYFLHAIFSAIRWKRS